MFAVLLAFAAAAHPAPARPADPVLGIWMNPKETVQVSAARCGPNLCGRVVWAAPEVQEIAAEAGTPRLVGTMLLRDFRPVGRGLWEGEVFVPDIGQTAQAQMTLVGPNELEINGCQFGGLMCKRQVWHRAPLRR